MALALAATGAGESEKAALDALCRAAERAWETRLREGVAAEDCGTAFPCAAAFTAAADLAAGRGGETAAFTAGAVSVRQRGAAENAALAGGLRKAAERLMAPYTEPGDFCFRGVQG